MDEKEELDVRLQINNPMEGARIDENGILTIESTIDVEKIVLQAVYKNRVIAEKTVRLLDRGAVTWLSDTDWKSAACGWEGKEVQRDYSIEGNTLTLLDKNGSEVIYAKGLGTHASSKITYDIAGKGYAQFCAVIGVDREMRENGSANLEFKVYFNEDERVLAYQSGAMGKDTSEKEIRIVIPSDSRTITLWIDDLGDNGADHADWADARFIKADRASNWETLETAMEQAKAKLTGDYSEELLRNLHSAFDQAE